MAILTVPISKARSKSEAEALLATGKTGDDALRWLEEQKDSYITPNWTPPEGESSSWRTGGWTGGFSNVAGVGGFSNVAGVGGFSNVAGVGGFSNVAGAGGSSNVAGGGYSQSDYKKDAAKDAAKDAEDAKDKAEKKARKQISKQYDAVRQGLDQLLGYLPQQQATARGKYEKQREHTRGRVGSELEEALSRFQGYEGEIEGNQKSTLRDLSSNTRNAFMAGNLYLGSKGASNSSAAGMYSQAIQQAANRNRADVRSGTDKNLADLNMEREQANRMATQQYAEIDNWFNNVVSDLETEYRQRKADIEMAKANASADEQAALADIDMQLWQRAMQAYENLQAQAASYAQRVGSNISSQENRAAQSLHDMRATSQFDWTDPKAENVGAGISQGSKAAAFTPQGVTKKDDDEYATWGMFGLGMPARNYREDDRVLPIS